jgi:hypothetical protein
MYASKLLQALKGTITKAMPRRLARSRRVRLGLEQLETRLVPSTIYVTNANASGQGSLTWAVQAADADPWGAPMQIEIANWLAGTTITPACSNPKLPNVALDLRNIIGEPIQIDGPQGGVTISGGGTRTVICEEGTGALNGLTITGGYGYDGGGIVNRGTLTLNNCTVFGNHADRFGGGVMNERYLTVSGGVVCLNWALDGGGIYNDLYTRLTVNNGCSLYGNRAQDGAAIDNLASADISTDYLYSNRASNDGGAIENTGTMSLEYSSLFNNSAFYGGAVHNDATLYIGGNTQFTNNSATWSGGAIDEWHVVFK